MNPALRAILDRFILDTANTKFVASSLPQDAVARPVPGMARTASQLFAHIADSLESQSQVLAQLAAGAVPVELRPGDRQVHENSRPPYIPALAPFVERMDVALNDLIRAASALDDAQLDAKLVGEATVLETLFESSRHLARHGLDFADALPELRFDPMMLNWLLYADYHDDAGRLARQRQLLVELREKYPDDEDDDD